MNKTKTFLLTLLLTCACVPPPPGTPGTPPIPMDPRPDPMPDPRPMPDPQPDPNQCESFGEPCDLLFPECCEGEVCQIGICVPQ